MLVEKFNSWTFREETPDGIAFITIVEKEPGVIEKIIFQIGKGSSSVNSYCTAIAELCNLYLSTDQGSISDLIESLFDIISSSTTRMSGPNAPVNRSGAEAMASVLRQYLQSLPRDVIEKLGERQISRMGKI